MDTSWDEYDAYDLSESAADFVHIDSNTTGPTARYNNRATAPEEDNLNASLCQSTVSTLETHRMLVIIVTPMIISTVSVTHWQQYQHFFKFHP
jgi:hypothetical protein